MRLVIFLVTQVRNSNMAGVACFVAVKAAETVVRLAEDPAARLVAGAQAPQNVPCRPLLCYSSRHFQKLVASYVRTCVALFCQGKITGHLVSAQLSGVTPASPTRHLALSYFLISFSFFFVFRSSCYACICFVSAQATSGRSTLSRSSWCWELVSWCSY